jgi:hypothetical protein
VVHLNALTGKVPRGTIIDRMDAEKISVSTTIAPSMSRLVSDIPYLPAILVLGLQSSKLSKKLDVLNKDVVYSDLSWDRIKGFEIGIR